jgi:2-polyprenyl-3-methyl-5-hydroxy-6-metoxy-1,4-benzoquinol methylase
LYGLLWRGSALLHRAGSAFEYLAGGVLLRRDMRAAMEIQFRNFGASADDVDDGLVPFELRVYGRWLPPGGRVLLVGCGAGRDVIGLARLGYQVTGVEPQAEQVEAARSHIARRGVRATVIHGPIETVDPTGPYDAIVFAPTCYSNIQSSSVRISTLSRLRSRLVPGGHVLINYIASASRSGVAAALLRTSAQVSSADWTPEPGDTFARYYESNGNLYFEHAFIRGEIAKECTAAGFTVVDEHVNATRADCIVIEVT